MMIRVAILGATGYTALELLKLLVRHPHVEITALTSRQEGKPPVSQIHPQLHSRLDLPFENLTLAEVTNRADCVFCCLPHGASAEAVGPLVEAGKRVVDFSADYRLTDPAIYQHWYDKEHVDPQRLDQAVYGLPELFRDQLPAAQLVANPGCYPTSANLALAPLLQASLIETDDIIIDSKSGVSGAGRTPSLVTHFPECNENLAAYKVGEHRHTPEIDQTLSNTCGQQVNVVFTPHLVPMTRGILTTAYSRPAGNASADDCMKALQEFYAQQPCVRVVDHLPATRDTVGTNYCDITVRRVGERILTISCLDNLLKGASGMAVQNLNLMHGFDEMTSL